MPAHLAQTPQRRPLELGISNCRYRGLLVVVLQGIPKHGWRWVRSEVGDFWGVSGTGLVQVRNEVPDYPARIWNKEDDQWNPSPEWQPVKEML